MSQSSKIFQKVPIQVPNRSGFDISHSNFSTLDVGTLTPIFTKLCLPNENISVGVNATVQLPPMATDFYGSVMLKYEAFFVPLRTLYGGWQDMVVFTTESEPVDGYKPNPYLPYVRVNGSINSEELPKFGAGSLADFLGMKITGLTSSQDIEIRNPLRFIAYHKIYDDWYRDSRIQKPLFSRRNPNSARLFAYNLPYQSPHQIANPEALVPVLYDGSSIFDLRQRNWEKDYFTNATTKPQAGNSMELQFDVDTEGETPTGKFSIRSLRAVNAIQQWLERNNMVGNRYADQIFARTGVYPSDAITDRAIYLGSKSQMIYNKSVYQTTPQDNESQNPFKSVGAKYSSPIGVDQFSIINDFHTTEHGYVMIIASIVPRPLYGSGTNREFTYQHIFDFPDALLQAVGDQGIYASELTPSFDYGTFDQTEFGYTQRFSEHKFMLDEVHGRLRDGENLDSFALQRTFRANTAPFINSAFLQIPKDYLDQVSAVSQEVSRFGAFADFGFSAKLVSTLAPYSIPTLGDPKDTHTEIVDAGGKRL